MSIEVKITVTLYDSTPEDVVSDLEKLGYQTGEVEVVDDDSNRQ